MRFVVAAALLVTATPALANDSSAAIGLGGIVLTKSAGIVMAREDLSINPKHVDVRYEFVNESGHDIDEIVAFPLPDLDVGMFFEEPLGTITDDPRDMVGFEAFANGTRIPVSIEQRAWLNGKDVTAALKAAGSPPNVLTRKGMDTVLALPARSRDALARRGLVALDGGDIHPLWHVTTKYYWRQHFPAGQRITIEHRYQPVTGQSFFTDYALGARGEADRYIGPYCMDAGTLGFARKRLAQGTTFPGSGMGPGLLIAYSTDYVLTTANNWKGPIGHFHLTLDKLKPSNVLSLCWDGELRKTGPTTFEAVRENFAPAHDISLLVLE